MHMKVGYLFGVFKLVCAILEFFCAGVTVGFNEFMAFVSTGLRCT